MPSGKGGINNEEATKDTRHFLWYDGTDIHRLGGGYDLRGYTFGV